MSMSGKCPSSVYVLLLTPKLLPVSPMFYVGTRLTCAYNVRSFVTSLKIKEQVRISVVFRYIVILNGVFFFSEFSGEP